MNTGNPFFGHLRTKQYIAASAGNQASLAGAINKALFLCSLCSVVSIAYYFLVLHFWVGDVILHGVGWPILLGPPLGIVFAVAIFSSPSRSRLLAPAFAVSLAFFLGGVSAMGEAALDGIIFESLLLTCSLFFVLLIFYRTGLIRVNDDYFTVYSKLIAVMLAIASGDCVLNIFFLHYHSVIFSDHPLSFAFSVLLAVLGGGLLPIEFKLLDEAFSGKEKQEKYMEWYFGFAVLAAMIWIYIAFFFLIARMRRRD